MRWLRAGPVHASRDQSQQQHVPLSVAAVLTALLPRAGSDGLCFGTLHVRLCVGLAAFAASRGRA